MEKPKIIIPGYYFLGLTIAIYIQAEATIININTILS